MNILFIIKVKILVLVKWSHKGVYIIVVFDLGVSTLYIV